MSFRKSIPCCLSALASLLLCAGIVSAQAAKPKYRQYAPPPGLFEDERAEKDFYAKQVVPVLRGRIEWGTNSAAVIDKWFKKKVLLEFTMQKNWGKLPELRASLLKDAKSASSPPAAEYLKQTMLTGMKAFSQARLRLHPAVRYNAMLFIGDLNDMEAGSRDAQGKRVLAPDPMASAFDVLTSEFKTTELDAIRVAAQVGILRHAKLNHARFPERRLENGKRLLAVKSMLDLVNAAPPAGRSVEGHTWMQRRGIEIMAAFDAVGEIAQVNAALEKIIADDAKPMSLRCTAAEALSRWRSDSPLKFDAKSLADSLGRLGGQALVNELEFIEKLQESEELKQQIRELIADTSTVLTASSGSTAGGGGSMSEMMMQGYAESGDSGGDEQDMSDAAMSMSDFFQGSGGLEGMGTSSLMEAGPEDPRVTRSRRRLKHQLACVQAGLEGIAKVEAAAAQKKSIDTVTDAISAAYATTDPDGADLPALEASIKKGLGALAFLMPEATVAADSALDPTVTTVPGDPTAPSAPGEPIAPADPTAAAPAPSAPAPVGPPDPGAPPPAGPAEPGIPDPADGVPPPPGN